MALMFFRGEGMVSQNKSMTIMFQIFGDPLHGPLNELGSANLIKFVFGDPL
jgi:hypothetical protein